ncbi:STE3-domain-containing protein [Peniophora sp. CONT]|nr:STE3-domain-containing protein [Peniophora sp. CONT]
MIMGAVDPTYPLFPVACVLSAAMVLLVLLTSFVRQSWNLGVAFLCFWLFFENLTLGINAVIWSDNADIKLYVYCDIVSRLQRITFVVKPMATLVITRRLYLIVRLRSVESPDKNLRRWNLVIDWTLGLVIPLIVAGPLYYVVQAYRFQVLEGFGCTSASSHSILDLLLLDSWSIIPPLISVLVYYPWVVWTYYRQKKSVNAFLRSTNSMSRTVYLRVIMVASIDVLLTLPAAIVNLVLEIVQGVELHVLPFYPGWTVVHTDWSPPSVSYADLKAGGTAGLAQSYFTQWTSPVLAFAIFGLFGLTTEARTSYWHILRTIFGFFGWKLPMTLRERHTSSALDTIEFGARPQETAVDAEMRIPRNSVDPDDITNVEKSGGSATRDSELTDLDVIAQDEKAHGLSSNLTNTPHSDK